MQQHLLLTSRLKEKMPSTIKVIFNAGSIKIIVEGNEDNNLPGFSEYTNNLNICVGENVIIEGEKEEIITWLKPFNALWIGNGIPQLESFTIMHVR